jgi:hypothetical protein
MQQIAGMIASLDSNPARKQKLFVYAPTHVPSFRGSLPGVWGFVELIALGDLGGRSSSGLSSLFLETTSGPVF